AFIKEWSALSPLPPVLYQERETGTEKSGLSRDPHLIARDSPLAVSHHLIAGDFHLPGNGLDHAQQVLPDGRVVAPPHRRGVNLVNKPVRSVGKNNYSRLMRSALHRFVLEIDPVRGQEDEGQNQGDHHIVVHTPALVAPEDVTAQSVPDASHFAARRRRCSRCFSSSLSLDQVLGNRLQRGWQPKVGRCKTLRGLAIPCVILPARKTGAGCCRSWRINGRCP